MKTLSKNDIIELHKDLIDIYDSSHGIRADALFDSALAAPFQSVGGVDFYPSFEEKAAQLGFGLVVNHPFLDGNKRIGAHSMLTFLTINEFLLNCSTKELNDMFFSIADGISKESDLLDWLRSCE